jgi:hypothetical protein
MYAEEEGEHTLYTHRHAHNAVFEERNKCFYKGRGKQVGVSHHSRLGAEVPILVDDGAHHLVHQLFCDGVG